MAKSAVAEQLRGTPVRSTLVWLIGAAFVSVPLIAFFFPGIYSYASLDGRCMLASHGPEHQYEGWFIDFRLLILPCAAAVLSYLTFVFASRRPRRARWRYLLGLLVAIAAFAGLVAIMEPNLASGYCQT